MRGLSPVVELRKVLARQVTRVSAREEFATAALQLGEKLIFAKYITLVKSA